MGFLGWDFHCNFASLCFPDWFSGMGFSLRFPRQILYVLFNHFSCSSMLVSANCIIVFTDRVNVTYLLLQKGLNDSEEIIILVSNPSHSFWCSGSTFLENPSDKKFVSLMFVDFFIWPASRSTPLRRPKCHNNLTAAMTFSKPF